MTLMQTVNASMIGWLGAWLSGCIMGVMIGMEVKSRMIDRKNELDALKSKIKELEKNQVIVMPINESK